MIVSLSEQYAMKHEMIDGKRRRSSNKSWERNRQSGKQRATNAATPPIQLKHRKL